MKYIILQRAEPTLNIPVSVSFLFLFAFLHKHFRLHMQQACLLKRGDSDTDFTRIYLCAQGFSYIKWASSIESKDIH